jgi:hypothetical protein
VPNEIEMLRKELAAANVEIENLRLRLSNVTYILKEEMTSSGRLPNLGLRDKTIRGVAR